MNRHKRSPAELVDASEHLLYEIDMFVGTATNLASRQPDHTIITNALLESFAVHTRALVAFFYDDKPRADDVIAEDYAPDWPQKRPATKSLTLTQAHERANKQIAHLTYLRPSVKPQEKTWRHTELVQEILTLCKAFLELVKASDVCPDLLKYKNPLMPDVATTKFPGGWTGSLGSPP